MYTNQNNSTQRRKVKRYNPGHSSRATRQTVIILTAVFLLGCAIGASVGIGIYRAVRGSENKETYGTVGIVDPENINDATSPLESGTTDPNASGKLICIDPGHGFIDGGAVSPLVSVSEYTINKKFSDMLGRELTDRGFSVVFTHDGIKFPSEYDYNKDGTFDEICTVNGVSRSERRDLAMALDPDYFISIHCNSYVTDASVGGMILYYEAENTESAKAASKIVLAMGEVEKRFSPVSPTRAEGKYGDDIYAVTRRWGTTPALLAELGYMTGTQDATYLQNDNWLTLVCKVYADAISAYFSE